MGGPELTFDSYEDGDNDINAELGEAASEAAGKLVYDEYLNTVVVLY